MGAALPLSLGGHKRAAWRHALAAWAMMRLGASRISSVFSLKVTPRTAIVLPKASPPAARITLCAVAIRARC